MMRPRWLMPEPVPDDVAEALASYSPVQRQILFRRGCRSIAQAEDFLHPREQPGADPFLLQGMREAIERILLARSKDEAVVVYGDYDTDGVTATALLVQLLNRYGVRASHYIPNRFDEGYGLNAEALHELRNRAASLVITVDCGTRSLEEARLASQVGLDLIVTDHHQSASALPAAVAIVNPKRKDDAYPFKDLSGVGVAYKLAQALARCLGEDDPADLLDLVAVGTVSDLAPLRGENRALVAKGLNLLKSGCRPGLKELARVSGVGLGDIRASTVSFALGPRLNAAGRMSTAESAFALLMQQDQARAEELARELDAANRERQRMTREMVERARALAQGDKAFPEFIFAAHADFSEGVIGLAAARLVDEFYRPAIVATLGEDVTRGSARSIPGFHVTEALDACSDLLLKYGGHSAAAGFSVPTKHLAALVDRLRDLTYETMSTLQPEPEIEADALVPLGHLDNDLLAFLESLEPCGVGNPAPVLVSNNLRILGKRAVGADGKHLKLQVSDQKKSMEAIAFGQGGILRQLPGWVDLAYRLERNTYWGVESLELQVVDVRPSQAEAPSRVI